MFQYFGYVADLQNLDIIFFAGALTVLVFFGIVLYLNAIRTPVRWGRILLGSAVLTGITLFLAMASGFDWGLSLPLEITLFGISCFIIGIFFLFAFIVRLISDRFMRSSLQSLAAFYGSSALVIVLFGIHWTVRGINIENDVFILLLLTSIAIAWIVLLIFSHRSPSDLLVLLAGETAIKTETILIDDRTFEQRCQRLQETYRLTAREGEVLAHVARGKTAASIAEELFVTRDTISTHTRHIYEKLGVTSKDQLIALVDSLDP
jgi:DNA-binding CsgD family transcriptional regulator